MRGEWLSLCATDSEVEAFSRGVEPPHIKVLIAALEATPIFENQILGKIKADSWGVMCAYTHTGGLHIQRWGAGDVIEPNYGNDEIRVALAMAEIFGALAVLGVAYLAGADRVAEQIWMKVKERFPH